MARLDTVGWEEDDLLDVCGDAENSRVVREELAGHGVQLLNTIEASFREEEKYDEQPEDPDAHGPEVVFDYTGYPGYPGRPS